MRTLVSTLVVAVAFAAFACSDDDKPKPDGPGLSDGPTAVDAPAAPDTKPTPTPDGTALDGVVSADGAGSMLGQSCTNPDGNTHADCKLDTDYCVPDVNGVEAAGLTKLTCTKKDCDPNDPQSCSGGMSCKSIPAFVIQMLKAQGIDLPATLCGK